MFPRRFRQPHSKYIYGVLVGRVTDGQENPDGSSPHYEILVDAAGVPYRIAVNVQSQDGSEVVVYYDPKYPGETRLDLTRLAAGAQGFVSLQEGQVFSGLDYLRDDSLFPLDQMRPLPADGGGVSLASLLDAQIERAKQDALAVIIAVGDKFDDDQTTENVGFKLGRGVHDIHMMQGNPTDGRFGADNRAHGDGALFLRFSGGETVALFTRFATQSTATGEDGSPSA